MYVFIVARGESHGGGTVKAVFSEEKEQEALAHGEKLAHESEPLKRVSEGKLRGWCPVIPGEVIARWENGDFVEITKISVS